MRIEQTLLYAFLLSCALTAGAAEPGNSTAADANQTLTLREKIEAGQSERRLQLEVHEKGKAAPLQTLELKMTAGAALKLRADAPLTVLSIPLTDGKTTAIAVTFGMDLDAGSSRHAAVMLARRDTGWSLLNEWATESGPLGDMGVSRVKQKIEPVTGKPDVFTRTINIYKVEAYLEKIDCGCNQCLSRTTDMQEIETYTWQPASAVFTQTALEKWYVIQPGEGLMSVARKALGDARLIARVIRLNPGIKPDQVVKEGQKILVQKK